VSAAKHDSPGRDQSAVELASTQRWFLDAVMHPGDEDAAAEVVTRSERMPAEERLAIYSRSYLARLIECLGETFPALKRSLGEPLFDAFAADYLGRHPSRSYTLATLGAGFPRHLAETRPEDAPEVGWPDLLVDLATLEWGIDEVFDGPGIEGEKTLDPDDLLGIPRELLPGIRLRTVPCLRLLPFRFPIDDYYTSLRRGDDPIASPPSTPSDSFMVLTRRDFVVRRHVVSRVQYEILSELERGSSIGKAIARGAASSELDDETLGRCLRQWFAAWARWQLFQSLTRPESDA
jgi:hypothetical protein